ncbi:MAG: hypothetical protein KF768_05475 [Phycisphaeraceae bacterium]|nr:hypothetical protein [Phycisphaeraceae bacterium]
MKAALAAAAASPDNKYFEHYKLAIDTLNAEMNRFWQRFQVLLIVEMALVTGVVVKLDDFLRQNDMFMLILVLGMMAYSFATYQIVVRGSEVYRGMYGGIVLLEEAAPEQVYLLRTVGSASDLDCREAPAMKWAKWIAFLLVLAWFAVFCYAVYAHVHPAAAGLKESGAGGVEGSAAPADGASGEKRDSLPTTGRIQRWW